MKLKELPLFKSINQEGYRFIGIFLGISLVLQLFGLSLLAKLFFFLALFSGYFFRDPERYAPLLENSVASPPDSSQRQSCGNALSSGEILFCQS